MRTVNSQTHVWMLIKPLTNLALWAIRELQFSLGTVYTGTIRMGRKTMARVPDREEEKIIGRAPRVSFLLQCTFIKDIGRRKLTPRCAFLAAPRTHT